MPSRVVMESTGDYWKGVYYLLEAEGFECWLVNARDVKNTPGRAKTDKLDAVWLAKVAERGMCRPSLVHPPEIRRLRDLTRYRRALVGDRARERQRVEKLLEDAQIKIGTVLTDIHGVSGRAMMEALIGGNRDPRSLARLAAGRAKRKTTDLEEALRGFFTDRHAVILRMMLDNDDRISGQIAALDAEIEAAIAPFARQAAQLCDLPGIDRVAAAELIGEIGVDMSRFPTSQHLVSWAKFCPRPHESAGKRRSSSRGKGNPWIAGILGRIVFSLSRTDTFLDARSAAGAAARQAESARGRRQQRADRRLASARRPRRGVQRSRAESLRIADQRRAPRPQPGYPTGGDHGSEDPHPRRQSDHRRPRGLTSRPEPAQHDPAPPGAFGLPTHHPIFGSAPSPSG